MTFAATCSDLLSATVTFGHEVTAHGFFGRLRQRGLEASLVPGSAQPTVALTAYTQRGATSAARLEVPMADVRALARMLLDLADRAEGSSLRPASCSISDLAEMRKAG
jgi:hypothetical protein